MAWGVAGRAQRRDPGTDRPVAIDQVQQAGSLEWLGAQGDARLASLTAGCMKCSQSFAAPRAARS